MSIVTKQSFQAMLDSEDQTFVMHVVGRALLVLLANQTAEEKMVDQTLEDNGVGFNGSDAPFGTGTAKFYRAHSRLSEKQMWRWTRKNDKGWSRLSKYWSQMNAAAERKRAAA